jgi:hypothetical protein
LLTNFYNCTISTNNKLFILIVQFPSLTINFMLNHYHKNFLSYMYWIVIYEVSRQCTIRKKKKINLRSKGYWWTHTSVCSSSLSVYVHEVSLCLCRQLICVECMKWIRSACSLWRVFDLQDCISSRNLSGSDQLMRHIQVKHRHKPY